MSQANRAALFGSKNTSKTANGSMPIATQDINRSKTSGMTVSKPNKPGITAEAKRKKLSEAQQLNEKATNALKTTIFQWSADYLIAASYFEQSAELYRQIEEYDIAIDLMIKAADAHENSKAMSSAALTRIKVSDIAKLKGDNNLAINYLLSAAETYAGNGDVTRYGELIYRVAREVEAFLRIVVVHLIFVCFSTE
jgi:hypothetical protein